MNKMKIISNSKYEIKDNTLYILENGDYKFYNITNYNIVISTGINVNIVEFLENSNIKSTNNFIIKNDSNVKYLFINESKDTQFNNTFNVLNNGNLKYYVVAISTNSNSFNCDVNLIKEGASCDFKLVSVSNEDTFNKFDVKVNNISPNTTGYIWQKGVVKNGGKNEFVATGFIENGCDGAKNFQESRVLLLDGASVGNASPLLLINHYNVEAGHAASVSRVNERELYYLQTRGISETLAQNMITIAFIKPLFDNIDDEELQSLLLDKINIVLS